MTERATKPLYDSEGAGIIPVSQPAFRLKSEVDKLLGKPFGWSRRGPDKFSCLGLYLHLVEVVTGIRIEDPYTACDEGRVTELWRLFDPVRLEGLPRPLDVLYFENPGAPHLSCVENERWAVASSLRLGVHRVPLWDELARDPRVYRLKELA